MKFEQQMKGLHTLVVITTKVVPAHAAGLRKFSTKDLRDYAKSLGLETKGLDKDDLIARLVGSGKATFCASLGN